MNKNKLTMAVIGGAGAVVALVVFVLAWMEGTELDDLRTRVSDTRQQCDAKRGISRKSGNEIKAATSALSEKAMATYASVSNGYLVAEVPEPSALQKLMNAAYERYKKLPADAAKKIVGEEFFFGPFAEYIKGTLPNEKDTPLLARRWGDVSEITDLLVQARATEITGVKIVTRKVEEPDSGRRRPYNRNAARKAAKPKYACSEESYEITFLARPAALVSFMNLLAQSKRFFSVDSVMFEQTGDPLLKMIGADSKEDARKKKEEAEETGDLERNKICVTDPATTQPFTVKMKITSMIFAEKKEAK